MSYLDIRERAETFFAQGQNITIKTIILDAGHGAEDPGAVSDISMVKEKDVNLKVVSLLKSLLESDGYKIILKRSEDILRFEPGTSNIVKKRRQDLERRKKLIDESGADICVSIHLNKFPQSQYFGAQVFYPPNFPESKNVVQE